MQQSATVGRDMLMVAGTEAEAVAQLVVASTEPLGRGEALEAPHTSDPSFDAPVILFQGIVFLSAVAMSDPPA